MINLTYTQKKWAMTSALLLVLGFSVSFNSHTHGLASLDLASETADDEMVSGKITTSGGVAKVRYIKVGDDKVQAFISNKAKTEGSGYCESCGANQYVLDVSFDQKDLEGLNSALLKKLEEEKYKTAKAKSKKAEAEDSEDDEDTSDDDSERTSAEIEQSKKYTKLKLKVIEKDCKDIGSSDYNENDYDGSSINFDSKFECLTSRLSELLDTDDSSRKKRLDKDLIQDFVERKIVKQASAELSLINRGNANQLINTHRFDRVAIAKLQHLKDAIATFIEKVPMSYEDVRGKFIRMEKAIIRDESDAIEAQKMLAKTDQVNGAELFNEAVAKSYSLTFLKDQLAKAGLAGVNTAISTKVVDPATGKVYIVELNKLLASSVETSAGTVINGSTTFPTISAEYANARLNTGFRGIGQQTIQNINQQVGVTPNQLPGSPVIGGNQFQYQPQQYQYQQPQFNYPIPGTADLSGRTGRGF